MTPPLLEHDAAEFREATGLGVKIAEDQGHFDVVIHDVALPEGVFNVASTDVLIVALAQYRDAALDMFYTRPDVLRADGRTPASAEVLEAHGSAQWRRFSFHRNGVWNRLGNGLLDHFEVVSERLRREGR